MNETNKTLIFVGVAVVVCAVARWTQPSIPGFDDPPQMVGELLTPEFKDPLAAASLEIVRYDEAASQVKTFAVAQKNGVWSLPSHSDYPADAKDQLGAAAAGVVGLKVLHVTGDSPSDHADYGVVDPGTQDFRPGTSGAGTRVVMKAKDGKALVALIIGKEMEKSRGIRYVRKVGEDAIYEVALQTDKLSSQFGDWIEKDLLKIDTSQLKEVHVNDYSYDAVQDALLQRNRMTLEYNDAGTPQWKLAEDQTFSKDRKWAPVAMAADQELKTAKLDDMRSAFGNLKIVNVARKPQGLSNMLRGTKAGVDRTGLRSLEERGFFIASEGGLVSSEGEILASMKDGVQYVLRFGGIAGRADAAKDAKAKDGKAKDAKAKDDAKDAKDGAKEKTPTGEVTRYLFVMCQFDRNAIAKPQEETLPPEPKADPKKDSAKTPAKEEAKTPPKEAAKEEAKTPPKEAAKEAPKPDLKAERERIEKDNKKKRDDFEVAVKAGEKRVKELNDRFADWYYEIQDSEYQKIHFGRKDVVQKKEEKKEGDASGAGLGPGVALPKDLPSDLTEPLKGGAPSPKTATPVEPKTVPPVEPKTVPPVEPKTATPAPAKAEPPPAKTPATPPTTPPTTPAASPATPAAKPVAPPPAKPAAAPAKK